MNFFCASTFQACDKNNNTLVPCWSTCAGYYNECAANDLLDWRCDPFTFGAPPSKDTDELFCSGK